MATIVVAVAAAAVVGSRAIASKNVSLHKKKAKIVIDISSDIISVLFFFPHFCELSI